MKKENGYKGKYSDLGVNQGDMSPHVESYQKSERSYSQSQFGTTTDYINRRDRFEDREASELRKQSYKGRYS